MDLLSSYHDVIETMKKNEEYRYNHIHYIEKMKYDLKKIIRFEKYIDQHYNIKELINELDKLYKK
jgi:hypothetical protein